MMISQISVDFRRHKNLMVLSLSVSSVTVVCTPSIKCVSVSFNFDSPAIWPLHHGHSPLYLLFQQNADMVIV